jgi:hypothetical protein
MTTTRLIHPSLHQAQSRHPPAVPSPSQPSQPPPQPKPTLSAAAPAQANRRSTLIEITPDGRAATDQLLPGIRTLEKSILSALTPAERAHLLDLLAKILARAAEVTARQPEPLNGQRIRPARPDGLPQSSHPR